MSSLQDEIGQLSPEQRKSLAAFLRQKVGQERTSSVSIPRRDSTLPTPLSFAQQRLWVLDQLTPNSPLYNQPLALRLTGPIHILALARALDALVARHEALRTTFELLG